MKKVLICGDSFAADWTLKYSGQGWPNLLAKEYNVTNLAQAGVGEYKIYLQLVSMNLDEFDKIIVSHTSPYRLYTKNHPVHKKDILHRNSDLIYADIKEHSKHDSKLEPLVHYFEEYFDMEYANFVHSLICEKIENITKDYDTLHLIHKESEHTFLNAINFDSLFVTNRGLMNHYDEAGNNIIYQKISEWIKTS